MEAVTLRDLEYIIALAQTGHFGDAAKQCHVSQPALSTQIKKVEDVLGVQIFERGKREATLTTHGEVLVRQAHVVLDEARKLFSVAKSKREPLTGELKLGAIATLGPYLMPSFLGPLLKRFPKLDLRIKEGHTEPLLEDVALGKIDAVLLSPPISEPNIEVVKLFFEPFYLACPTSHRLAKETVVQRKDLDAAEMLFLEEGNCLAEQSLNLCPVSRRKTDISFHATSLETLRHMIALGQGYSLVPFLAVDNRMPKLIRYVPFESKTFGRAIGMAFKKNSSNRDSLLLLCDFMTANLPDGLVSL